MRKVTNSSDHSARAAGNAQENQIHLPLSISCSLRFRPSTPQGSSGTARGAGCKFHWHIAVTTVLRALSG